MPTASQATDCDVMPPLYNLEAVFLVAKPAFHRERFLQSHPKPNSLTMLASTVIYVIVFISLNICDVIHFSPELVEWILGYIADKYSILATG